MGDGMFGGSRGFLLTLMVLIDQDVFSGIVGNGLHGIAELLNSPRSSGRAA